MVKAVLLFLHRWLGVISGLIVFVVSVTGAIFVFEEELFRAFNPDIVYVTPEQSLRDINELRATAQKSIGQDKNINVVFIPGSPDRAYCFSAFERNAKSESIWDKDEIAYYYQVFVNPYTGAVTGVVNKEIEFFYAVRRIHQNLMLRRDIGNMIVGTSTLIFLFILISGVVLWWPQRIAQWKQRFVVKWKARWRRLNYDLHSVVGFYVFLIAMLIAITGLVWSFDWWENGIYAMLGSSKKDAAFLTQRDTTYTATNQGITLAWKDALKRYEQGFERITLNFPTKKNSRVGAFVLYDGPSAWTDSDYIYYNGATGNVQQAILQDAKSTGMKWRNTNYYIHTGKLYGWPTQILAVIASLICASLPVTGVILWVGRKNKKQVPASPQPVSVKTKPRPRVASRQLT
jgi:uncharacterized iron-regulated membrane protein